MRPTATAVFSHMARSVDGESFLSFAPKGIFSFLPISPRGLPLLDPLISEEGGTLACIGVARRQRRKKKTVLADDGHVWRICRRFAGDEAFPGTGSLTQADDAKL